jgi:hypothetical protein
MQITEFVFAPGKLFAISAGVYYFKYLSKAYRLVLFLIAIALSCEFYGYYLSYHLKQHNAWLFNIYMLIEVWMMVGAALYLINNGKIRLVFFSALIINSVFWLGTITAKTIYTFANMPMITGCLLMASVYLFLLINHGIFNRRGILSEPIFWLAISIILYAVCVIPFMAMHDYLTKHMSTVNVRLHLIISILDIVRYPLAGISFVVFGKMRKKLQIR